MKYFLVDIVPGETEIVLFSVGNTVVFPARLHSSEPLHSHSCFQRLKVPRFVAPALGMEAAWQMKKKSIIFLFFFPLFALLSQGQGDREGRAGVGVGTEG